LERLLYGTWLVVSARGVEAAQLRGAAVREGLERLAAVWPLGADRRFFEIEEEGVSRGVVGSQGQAAVHAFPLEGWLVVTAFAVAEVPVGRFMERVEQVFDLSVYDLQRSRYGALWPGEGSGLERGLRGERFLARARSVPRVG
jgi:hypothetical protein